LQGRAILEKGIGRIRAIPSARGVLSAFIVRTCEHVLTHRSVVYIVQNRIYGLKDRSASFYLAFGGHGERSLQGGMENIAVCGKDWIEWVLKYRIESRPRDMV
jgi:hypothetical protein